MKIGIVGSGLVGVTLANGLQGLGHDVMIGSNTEAKKETLAEEMTSVAIGSFEEASNHGEVVFFCVRGSVGVQVISPLAQTLAGKTVIDTTNPISDNIPPTDGVVTFFTDNKKSLMEMLQEAAPDARLVKAFNSTGNAVMVKPDFSETPTMFICGNDDDAKQQVTGLLTELGWESADMGTAVAARAIEPLCMLWCIPGFKDNDWFHAFKLLKK